MRTFDDPAAWTGPSHIRARAQPTVALRGMSTTDRAARPDAFCCYAFCSSPVRLALLTAGRAHRSGASGRAASPTTKAVRWPTSVKVGLRAALPANAASAPSWHRDRQGGSTYPDAAPATPKTK